jgi:diguanylate cyclase (GGDEF)-like protein
MDGLKEINDTLGHPAGDRAIIAMANILKGALRDSDNLARIGGDEFAAVIGGCSEDVIKTIGTRIQRAIVESTETREQRFSV